MGVVRGSTSGLPDTKYNVQFYWVDRAQKTTPVLVVSQVTCHNLSPGELRGISVISLPSGWSSRSSIQGFNDGPSNAGVETFSVGYDTRDQLQLTTSSGDIVGTTNTYAWNGKLFSVIKSVHYETSERDQ